MKKQFFLFIFFSTLAFGANECVVCHKGIEDIRDRDSGMMKEILKVADKAGHKGNDCIVCHGGNPYNKSKEYGHKGSITYLKENGGPKEFYPAPTDPSINKNTCGMCHEPQVNAQYSSVMMDLEADANETNTSQSLHPIMGSKKYIEYMDILSKKEPEVFLEKKKMPHSNSLHHNSKGCATCHMPFGKDALYKGNDVRIDKKQKGHILVHKLQSSSKTRIEVYDNNYTAIPIDTCANCHDEKDFITRSYKGILKISSKHHLDMQEDIHFRRGMVCQDCHSSNDVHGSGYKTNENLASVEVECQDCHGTTKKYPWELPIGFSDEFNTSVASGNSRGVAKDLAKYLKQGFVAEQQDGYLLSARANPMPNVVRKDNLVIVHLANGKFIELKPLKLLKLGNDLSDEALVAMDSVDAHTNKLECYTCHTKWAPQFYKNKMNTLIRWEKPVLAQNGEGRVSPLVRKGDKSIAMHVHNVSEDSRSCESCHSSTKAMGFGLDGVKGDFTKTKEIYSNFKLASVLNKDQLDKLDRRDSCVACHKSIPKGNLAVSALVHAAKMAEINVDKKMHNEVINMILNTAAWAQIAGAGFILLIIMYIIYVNFIKKKPINPRNEGWK